MRENKILELALLRAWVDCCRTDMSFIHFIFEISSNGRYETRNLGDPEPQSFSKSVIPFSEYKELEFYYISIMLDIFHLCEVNFKNTTFQDLALFPSSGELLSSYWQSFVLFYV